MENVFIEGFDGLEGFFLSPLLFLKNNWGEGEGGVGANVFHHHFRQVISIFTLPVAMNDAINTINFQ